MKLPHVFHRHGCCVCLLLSLGLWAGAGGTGPAAGKVSADTVAAGGRGGVWASVSELTRFALPEPPEPPWTHKPAVWVGGDSASFEIGAAVARVVEKQYDARVRRFHKPSTGLARLDCFDWPGELAKEMKELDPSVVVLFLGGNDGQNVVTKGNQGYRFGSKEWRAEYSARVSRVMDALCQGGRKVVWLGLPISKSKAYSDNMKELNGVYRELAASRKDVRFVDTWSMLAGAKGEFAESLPDARGKMRRMRTSDGMHFYPAAAERVVGAFSEELLQVMAAHFPQLRKPFELPVAARSAAARLMKTGDAAAVKPRQPQPAKQGRKSPAPVPAGPGTGSRG